MKKLNIILASIITAFMIMSSGYSIWEKELNIIGSIKVVEPPPVEPIMTLPNSNENEKVLIDQQDQSEDISRFETERSKVPLENSVNNKNENSSNDSDTQDVENINEESQEQNNPDQDELNQPQQQEDDKPDLNVTNDNKEKEDEKIFKDIEIKDLNEQKSEDMSLQRTDANNEDNEAEGKEYSAENKSSDNENTVPETHENKESIKESSEDIQANE